MILIYLLISFAIGVACGVVFHKRITDKANAALVKGKKELREELDKAKTKLD